MLVATDRSGVLASEDGGTGFQESNTGFSQRQVTALLVDAKSPQTMYAGVINDKSYGGVFVSSDLGRTWKQQSDGLHGGDIFVLAQSEDGALLAGSSDGIFRWDGSAWVAADALATAADPPGPLPVAEKPHGRAKRGPALAATAVQPVDPPKLGGRVTALSAAGDTWFAVTTQGIFRSNDRGASWTPALTANRRRAATT